MASASILVPEVRLLGELEGVRRIYQLTATVSDRLEKARRVGRKIVGVWTGSPNEIIFSTSAFALQYKRREEFDRAFLESRDRSLELYLEMFGYGECICREVEGSSGSPLFGLDLHFDLVITDFPQKHEKWMELIERSGISGKRRFLFLEIPRGLTRSEAQELIAEKLELARKTLEDVTGERITDDMLNETIERLNVGRRYIRELEKLGMADPFPVKIFDWFMIECIWGDGFWGSAVDELIEAWRILVEEVKERVRAGLGEYPRGAPRLMQIGLPHKHLWRALERYSGVVVVDWPYGEYTLSREEIEVGDDPIWNMAKVYSRVPGLYDPDRDAREVLSIAREHRVDGVVYSVQDPYGYAAVYESKERILEELERAGIPALVIDWREMKNEELVDRKVREFIADLWA